MTDKERKVFLRFLKDEGLFTSFTKYLPQGNFARGKIKRPPDVIFGEYLQMVGARGAISMAFCWGATSEGWSFWNKKDEKWRKFFKKM